MKNITITSKLIKELVEEITNIDLTTKKRYRNIVQYRFVAFKLSKELTFDSLSYIGKLYGKDHATVLHGINKFKSLENQYDFKDAKKLYDRCYDILVPIPKKFKEKTFSIKKPEKEYQKIIINKKELTPIQKLVENLTPSQEEELTELITLRKKSWEWKNKDSLKLYTGS